MEPERRKRTLGERDIVDQTGLPKSHSAQSAAFSILNVLHLKTRRRELGARLGSIGGSRERFVEARRERSLRRGEASVARAHRQSIRLAHRWASDNIRRQEKRLAHSTHE